MSTLPRFKLLRHPRLAHQRRAHRPLRNLLPQNLHRPLPTLVPNRALRHQRQLNQRLRTVDNPLAVNVPSSAGGMQSPSVIPVGFAHNIPASADEPKQVVAAPPGDTDGSLRFFLGAFGAVVLLTAWVPMLLKKRPISLPMICIAIGFYRRRVATAPAGKFESVGERLCYPAANLNVRGPRLPSASRRIVAILVAFVLYPKRPSLAGD
jgi:hypothetical protein